MDALSPHRLHFAFTITYHYLFPQLTMGLAPSKVWQSNPGPRTLAPWFRRVDELRVERSFCSPLPQFATVRLWVV